MDQAVKAEVKKEYQKHDRDTGSVEVQVALMSGRISELTEHLKTHKKDNSTRRGLITLVNKRRKLLSYLAKEDDARYKELIQRLGLRR
ncbi:MAG: 30S ribosomal protein S15 [Kiritimatiellales bacterium]